MKSGEIRWWLIIFGCALAVGAASGLNPVAGLLVAGTPIVLIAAVLSAPSRLVIVLGGGLLVFQSQTLGPLKYGYLAVALLCVGVSGLRLARSPDPVVATFRPLLGASAGLVALIGASALIAHSNGVLLDNWVRDALPYMLLAVLPVVGLDAGRDLSGRTTEIFIAALGLLGAAGMAVDWLHRRNVSSLEVGRVVLSLTSLVALGFALAMTRAAVGPHRLRWLGLAAAIVTLMLTTGSRANLVVLFAALGVVGASKKARVSAVRAGAAIAVIVAAVAVLLPWLVGRVSNDPQFLNDRISRALLVLNGQGSADLSYQARQQAYNLAMQQFHTHPWWGTGPGFLYPDGAFTLDTPALTIAKWGLVGTAVLAGYLVTLAICFLRVRRRAGYGPINTVARSWLIAMLAWLPFGIWLEDKGFALVVTLLAASVVAYGRESLATRSQVEVPDGVGRDGDRMHDPALTG